MGLREAKGSKIRLRLLDFPKELTGALTGIFVPDGWIAGKLTDVDEFGIWLENPQVPITKAVDQDGHELPVNQRSTAMKRAEVLIRWGYVGTVVRITDDEILDNSTYRIGFHQ